MRRTQLMQMLVAGIVLAATGHAIADNGSYSGSGGVFTTGTAAGQNIAVQTVPLAGLNASVSFTCPITSYGAGTYQLTWVCAGGSVSIASTDSTISLNGAFVSGSMTFSGSGGGRGGHVAYWYVFSGRFRGTLTAGGTSERVLGSISTTVKTTSQLGSGGAAVGSLSMGWNSAYAPVVVGDAVNSRLLGADNLTGVSLVTYGSFGSGSGQFNTIAGLAHDASGRIYVTDSTLNRIVRIDDLTGKNWTELGISGSGNLNFSGPLGVAIDAAGKIWVADSGNNRIIRMDDMAGTNWTTFGTAGSGANQFSLPAAIAFDPQGRIYVADPGNGRLVRFDDLTGKNWIALTQINIDPYGYLLAGVNAVAVLPSGRIYASTASGWLYRIDDMTGANGEAASWTPSIAGFSLDPAGTLYVAGGFSPGLAQTLDAFGTADFSGSMGQATLQPSAVLAMATTTPPPAAGMISRTSLAFGQRNVGEPGAAQTVTVTNLGGQPLTFTSIASSADFPLSNGCASPLAGGAICSMSLRFDPVTTGSRSATLKIESNGAHPLLETTLFGMGTAPKAVLFPATLTFDPQKTGTVSGSESLTLTNPGSGPLTVSSIAATGDFSATSNCPGVLSAGSGCTIQVAFTPSAAGSRSGSLIVSDDLIPAGAQQSAALSGTGSAAAPAITLTPESLFFPVEQINVASTAQTVTLTNGSSASVSPVPPVYPAGFKGTTTCGTPLAPGASCALHVQFVPTAAGSITTKLNIPVSGGSVLSVGLAGSGVSGGQRPVLVSNPASASFGMLTLGDDASLSVTLANPSGVPVGIRSIALTGSSAFTNAGNNCPSILAGGVSCTVRITFIPPSVATYSGTLTVTENSGAVTPIAISGSAGTGN